MNSLNTSMYLEFCHRKNRKKVKEMEVGMLEFGAKSKSVEPQKK